MLSIIGDIAIIIVLIALVFLIFFGVAWKKSRTCQAIIKDLRKRGAVSRETAVSLPFFNAQHYESGMKNYQVKALDYLLMRGVVRHVSHKDRDWFYLAEVTEGDA